MKQPTQWSREQLTADVLEARTKFRVERLDEPLEQYSAFFDAFTKIFTDLVGELGEFAAGRDPDKLASIVSNSNRRTALRYMTAPPISEDDLEELAKVKLSAAALRRDPDSADRVRAILLHVLDRHRFPWLKEGRKPSNAERQIAIVSSAAMVSAKKVETDRRTKATKDQEQAVKSLLNELGFIQEKRRKINLLDDARPPGRYCGESLPGGTRADVVVRLSDRRVLAIECKASNSEVNSYKRVNHEALGKARKWLAAFGKNATVPTAVLSGVFGVGNLSSAQEEGLNLFWSHRLKDLEGFIQAT